MKIEEGSWGYALLCVAAPTLWGLFIVWVTKKFEKRLGTLRRHTDKEAQDAVPDYHI